jgi:hypothetical protein
MEWLTHSSPAIYKKPFCKCYFDETYLVLLQYLFESLLSGKINKRCRGNRSNWVFKGLQDPSRDVFQKQSLTTWDCVWGRLDDGFYIFLQSPSYTFPLVHCYAISNLVTFLCKAKLREKLYRFLSPSLYVTFCQLAVAAHSDILQKSLT